MRYRLKLLLIAVSTALSACAVNLPQPDAAQLVPQEPSWQAATPSAVRLAEQKAWWGAWQDPVLDTLLNAAQQANPTLEFAQARIREARAKAYSAKSYLWPTIGATATGTRSQNELVSSPSYITNNGSVGLDASWEIDLWGGIRAAEQGLLANMQAREVEWHDAQVSVAAEVANAYVALRAYQAMADIVAADLESRNRSLQLTQDKASVGLASPVDVALADASSADSVAQLAEMQEGIDSSIKALVAVTGLSEREVRAQISQGARQLPQPLGFTVTSLPAEVITQRHDIRVEAEKVKAAAADVGIAKVARLPSLSLFGAISVGRQETSSLELNGNTWSFGPTVKLPIFNAGRLKSEEEAAQARFEQAVAMYQQQVRFAVREVEQTMVKLNSSNQRVAATLRSVAGYQKQQDATNAMWKAGSASLFDLEISRRFLLTAQTKQISLQREQLALWIALYKAVGGEWPQHPVNQ
ncbi:MULTISPECIES: efflux transporter outer membrane subunit [Deefgea]|uniref:Efflux transporter outer membrane subunit n=1 Tax=Deefgea chitinilytica TaxID=570276 RepID=A0ABS2CF19_9NEIS|nr:MULTISPECIES: efflux transporter outer membrane subunit [Deefgea]MBM5572735.1 efflux transporter outer membrane subunit [Deefgea chitinilytica]MBM9889971.1 efflux transporter outer membrane subunit [Deefgea sp. CFH1-16]